MRAVVVTGGMGSGKSTFCRVMRAGDAGGTGGTGGTGSATAHIDADRIVRGLLRHHRPLQEQIASEFGADLLVPGKGVDRQALAARVFGDRGRLKRLEALVHPIVRARMARKVASLKRKGAVAIVLAEIPLLAEGGVPEWCDFVVTVEADPGTRLARLLGRGVSPEDARRRIRRQATDEQRRRLADLVVRNDGDLEDLREAAARVRRLVRRARR